jgi:acyl dehydratase
MTDQTRPRGRYFEEFEIGEIIESAARTVTETDVVIFAGLSGDYNQLHTDVEYAKDTLFGERVAHGLLGLAIVSGLAARLGFIEGTVQAFRELEWKFSGPIKIGDTIRARFEIRKKREMRRLGSGLITLNVAVLNQRDEVVQKGVWKALIKSAP